MTQTRCVMIDKSGMPNTPEVRHVRLKMLGHPLNRSPLSTTQMHFFCNSLGAQAANLDALPAVLQEVIMLHNLAEL